MAGKLFWSLQAQLAYRLPLPPSRYVMRDREGRVSAVATVSEWEGTSVLTLIDGAPLPSLEAARERLLALAPKAERERFGRLCARVFRALRAASEEPLYHPPPPSGLLALYAGYGAGEELAHGALREGRSILPTPAETVVPQKAVAKSSRRARALDPQDRFAAFLSGRLALLDSAELTLRARADLLAGELTLAAFELERALAVAAIELASLQAAGERTLGGARLADRYRKLAALRAELGAAVERILAGGAPPQPQALEAAVSELAAALRVHTYLERFGGKGEGRL